MIRPTSDEILSALVTAFDEDITPHLRADDGGYTASQARTFAQLLRAVRVRVAQEDAALTADIMDAREILRAHAAHVSGSSHQQVASVLAEPDPPAVLEPGELTDMALRVRAAVEAILEDQPDQAPDLHAALYEHLVRSLEREVPWMVQAFTGPRR